MKIHIRQRYQDNYLSFKPTEGPGVPVAALVRPISPPSR